MRLIDADEMALNETKAYMSAQIKLDDPITLGLNSYVHRTMQMLIADTPTVDAIPVVRCRECQYGNNNYPVQDGQCVCEYYDFIIRNHDDFCSRGERRTGNDTR